MRSGFFESICCCNKFMRLQMGRWFQAINISLFPDSKVISTAELNSMLYNSEQVFGDFSGRANTVVFILSCYHIKYFTTSLLYSRSYKYSKALLASVQCIFISDDFSRCTKYRGV